MMGTIKYFLGEEKIVVEEKKDFATSIFSEQYKQAIKLLYNMAAHPMNNIPNLVAFCGDRGEGKSSCMISVRHMLQYYKRDVTIKNYVDTELEKENLLVLKEFEFLPVIDPAFFDKNHNVLELILGHIYSLFKKTSQLEQSSYADRNEIAKEFQKVKLHLKHLDRKREELYDPLEELESLAAGINLKKSISTLMEKYLKLVHKNMLVISIDDLDLNMSEAYTMCEQIRKYLCNEHCILLISLKIDQLLEAIQNAIHKDAQYPNHMDVYSMATKYVTKLIPSAVRINMPKVYDLCENKLEVYSSREEGVKPVFSSSSVKEGVVRKIFYTTRYLFYNSKGSTSLIVPNNLRSLFQLLGLLFSMEEFSGKAEKKAIHATNKELFKNYFYHLWSEQLSDDYQKIVKRLVASEGSNDAHKFVVHHLSAKLPSEVKSQDLMKEIINPSNYNYNISVGDVLYILSYLEQNTFDEDLKMLLFFIKSYYSIRLYESYDITTEKEGELYPTEQDTTGRIYKHEAWFKRTNALQRFVAGGYFVYAPDELIAPKGQGNAKEGRDYRVIQGTNKGVTTLFINIKRLLDLNNEVVLNNEGFQKRFRLAEFFVLSIITSIYQREARSRVQIDRKDSDPYYLTSFNTNTGYYIFDVMAPFYQMTNIQYAYDRFKVFVNLFEPAYKHEWSLLHQMITEVRNKIINACKPEDKEKIPTINDENRDYWLKRLASNAVLRNLEVVESVMENIKSNRYKERSYKSTADLFAEFYDNIINTAMATYKQDETKPAYLINFEFLNPIVMLLKDASISEELTIETVSLSTFEDIFSLKAADKEANDLTEKDIYDLLPKIFNNYRLKNGTTLISRMRERYPILYAAIAEDEWNNIISPDISYSKTQCATALKPYYDVLKEAKNNEPTEQEENVPNESVVLAAPALPAENLAQPQIEPDLSKNEQE